MKVDDGIFPISKNGLAFGPTEMEELIRDSVDNFVNLVEGADSFEWIVYRGGRKPTREVVDERRIYSRLIYSDGFLASKLFLDGPEGEEIQRALAAFDRAIRLMKSRRAKAFRLEDEPANLRAAYGEHKFGQSCLLARRLVEAGVSFVEVVHRGWDDHNGAA